MKTAEEWCQEYWKLKSNPPPFDGCRDKPPRMHEWDVLVDHIQQDAYRQGLQDAINISRRVSKSFEKRDLEEKWCVIGATEVTTALCAELNKHPKTL